MKYSLFLDDIRTPPSGAFSIVARTVPFAKMCVEAHSWPTFISFDHDLGDGQETGYDFAKWLVERALDSEGRCVPADFGFTVHSANPVGAANIRGLLGSYLKHLKRASVL